MTEMTMYTLTALAEACEGRLELGTNGVRAVITDDDLNVFVEYEDGTRVDASQADEAQVMEAVTRWREQHHAFFQRVLGAMM